jgi:hypothetical protein
VPDAPALRRAVVLTLIVGGAACGSTGPAGHRARSRPRHRGLTPWSRSGSRCAQRGLEHRREPRDGTRPPGASRHTRTHRTPGSSRAGAGRRSAPADCERAHVTGDPDRPVGPQPTAPVRPRRAPPSARRPRGLGTSPAGRHTSPDQTAALMERYATGWREHGLDVWVTGKPSDDGAGALVGIGGCSLRHGLAWNPQPQHRSMPSWPWARTMSLSGPFAVGSEGAAGQGEARQGAR